MLNFSALMCYQKYILINSLNPPSFLKNSRQMVMQCKATLMTVCKMRLYALCVEMHCDKAT